MEEQLISKKELLELTGISYGQLYRWKRKSLVPEEWFIRKSSFTGQETFFPKERMLERIDKILNMKDDLSLDELADMFSPAPTDLSMTRAEVLRRNIVSNIAMEHAAAFYHDPPVYTFDMLLSIHLFDVCLQRGDMTLEEGMRLLQMMESHLSKFDGGSELIFIRKMGISTFMLIQADSGIYFEPDVKVVLRLSVAEWIEALKLKLNPKEEAGGWNKPEI